MLFTKRIVGIIAKYSGTVPAWERFAEHRTFQRALRSMKDGEGLLRVRPDHPEEVIAELGKAFHEIISHPLIKPFLRHSPKLVLVHPDTVLPGLGQVKGAAIYGRNVFMDACTYEGLAPKERKALLAHEIAHHVGLDTHARNSIRSMFRRALPSMEMNADKIAVTVTRDAEALDSALKKLNELHPVMQEVDRIANEGSFTQKIKQNAFGGFYLPPEERSKFIQRIGERTASPEGYSHLEKVIKGRLEKEHTRVFGHHTSGR